MENELTICCRICSEVLCRGEDLMQDEINANAECGSFFLESPCKWMEDAASSTEGKLACPRCSGRVGRISWIGFEAIRGRWISPAIMITKSRADFKWRSREEPPPSQLQSEVGGPPEENNSSITTVNTEIPAELASNLAGDNVSPADVVPATFAELDSSSERDVCLTQSAHQQMQSDDNATDVPLAQDIPQDSAISVLAPSSERSSQPNAGKGAYSKQQLATMDMLDLVKLLDAGDIEMDDLIEACDEAAARKKAEMRRSRDLSNPQVLMSAIKEEIGDQWPELRSASAKLKRGELSSSDYYFSFAAAFVQLDREGLLVPLLGTLPDEAKRAEIMQLHREWLESEGVY